MSGKTKKLHLKFQLLGIYLVIFIILALVGLWFYWFQLRPVFQRKRVLSIKRECKEKVYSRPNELNFEWAEGKEWMPLPGELFSAEYGWLYPNQSSRLKSRVKTVSFAKCLEENNLSQFIQEGF